jgi:polysaccharide biosynthesis/export protein
VATVMRRSRFLHAALYIALSSLVVRADDSRGHSSSAGVLELIPAGHDGSLKPPCRYASASDDLKPPRQISGVRRGGRETASAQAPRPISTAKPSGGPPQPSPVVASERAPSGAHASAEPNDPTEQRRATGKSLTAHSVQSPVRITTVSALALELVPAAPDGSKKPGYKRSPALLAVRSPELVSAAVPSQSPHRSDASTERDHGRSPGALAVQAPRPTPAVAPTPTVAPNPSIRERSSAVAMELVPAAPETSTKRDCEQSPPAHPVQPPERISAVAPSERPRQPSSGEALKIVPPAPEAPVAIFQGQAHEFALQPPQRTLIPGPGPKTACEQESTIAVAAQSPAARSSSEGGSAQVDRPANAICQIQAAQGPSPPPGADGSALPNDSLLDARSAATNDVIKPQFRQLTDEGLKLAAKGAMYSARAKYIEVLQLGTDFLDAKRGTESQTRALASGLLALREADDFISGGGTAIQAGSDPLTISVAHTTPVLKNARASRVTRMKALQLYYSYATRQLARAVDGLPEASTALCYLGRLQPYLVQGVDRKAALSEPKSLAFDEAAVMVNPRNFLAANELGVVLAKCGKLQPAKKALLYSASLRPRAETYHNLAVVYERLGDDDQAKSMAAIAEKERRAEDNGPRVTEPTSSVYWVDHKAFVTQAAVTDFIGPPAQNEQAAPGNTLSAENSSVQSQQTKPGLFDWLRGPAQFFGASPRTNSPDSSESGGGSAASLQPAPERGDQREEDGARPVADQENGEPQVVPVQQAFGPSNFIEPFTWEIFAQGEYIGPARLAHVPEYFLRVDDNLQFVFRLSGKPAATPYRLNVGDVIRIGSRTVPTLNLETLVEPDGVVLLPQVGPVVAAGKSMEVLRAELDQLYRPFIKEPAITITPLSINKTLEELRAAIVNRQGVYAGQGFITKVSPNGTVQLPAIGSVPVQGLSLPELRDEINYRYAELVDGVEVTPILAERAPRSIYVLGEVAKPGKFALDAPTTVIQAIAMAGSWNIGGNTREVIVFRRDEQWRLMATRVNVKPGLYNRRGLCADDIWLRDSDIVIVPKCHIQVLDDFIQLVFTRGIYGVFPISFFTQIGPASVSRL